MLQNIETDFKNAETCRPRSDLGRHFLPTSILTVFDELVFSKWLTIERSARNQSCQVSRFTRESPGFRADLQVSRLVLKISRILTKIQLAKILSVLSKENAYVFVRWEIKKRKSPQFVVQIKVVVQNSRKNSAILAICCSGKFFLTPKMVH